LRPDDRWTGLKVGPGSGGRTGWQRRRVSPSGSLAGCLSG